MNTVTGKDLELGMVVIRLNDKGQKMTHQMIVYSDGPYYKNPLYKDDVFLLVSLPDSASDYD